MVITHNNKTEIVDTLQDCLNLADRNGNRELIEATEYIINNGEEGSLQDRYDDLEAEFKSYEFELESRENCLREVKEVSEELKDMIEKAKRLNKEEIIDYLRSIIDTIDNEY